MIYNVVLISGAQQSDSVIHISTLFFSFCSHLGHRGNLNDDLDCGSVLESAGDTIRCIECTLWYFSRTWKILNSEIHLVPGDSDKSRGPV